MVVTDSRVLVTGGAGMVGSQFTDRLIEAGNEVVVAGNFETGRQSTPKDELLERLRNYDGPPYVVILDEVDQLQDKSLLYDLYRMRDLTMVLIANREEDVFSTLDGRLNSRLASCARIKFGQYNIRELVTILEDRARWGLEPDAVDEQHLERVS